ncbi:MAG: DUF4097 family beta strand repeat-containing protein [Ktedonobacterales bacterium]
MATEKTETHEFIVTGEPAIVARSAAGNLTITAGPDGQVHVQVTKRGHGGILGHADEHDLDKVHVDVRQEGNRITVEADKRPSSLQGKHITIDIEITAPSRSTLDLRLAAGNMTIRGISGLISAKVDAGNVDLTEVTLADRSRLSVNAGNLTVKGALAAGASLDAQVNAGNARFILPRETAAYLDARSQAGNVHVPDWYVSITRNFATQAAYGPLGANPAGTLTIRVTAGNITVEGA